MMSWFGVAQSINNLLSVFISPVVGSLSDAVGRKWNPGIRHGLRQLREPKPWGLPALFSGFGGADVARYRTMRF